MKSLQELDLKNQELEEDYAYWLKVNNQYTDEQYNNYHKYRKEKNIQICFFHLFFIIMGILLHFACISDKILLIPHICILLMWLLIWISTCLMIRKSPEFKAGRDIKYFIDNKYDKRYDFEFLWL